jgi:hypothetical protein
VVAAGAKDSTIQIKILRGAWNDSPFFEVPIRI